MPLKGEDKVKRQRDRRREHRNERALEDVQPSVQAKSVVRQVYFIADRASQAIKIGASTNPVARLDALQTGNPNKLELIAVLDDCDEREVQQYCAIARLTGEWFRFGEGDNAVKQITNERA